MTAIKLDTMSEEQFLIYEKVKSGENVIVDACAGSGKSTTILSIATLMPQTQFIQLTYNNFLSREIKHKIEGLAIPNITVFTYHGLMVNYYTESHQFTDVDMHRFISKNDSPKKEIKPFNVLVIDECQDMTKIYFQFIVKFCKDYGKPIQLLILGDQRQELYEFKGSDKRFLVFADKNWNSFQYLKSEIFHHCSLRMSYRITNQIADFVNKVMLGEERLLACRNGKYVEFLHRSNRDMITIIASRIRELINQGCKPSDFFILAGSVKSKGDRYNVVREIENILVLKDIPCHIPPFEDEITDERVIEGKVVFSTFHSVKGRQRKYVFVLGFDHNYFTYNARTFNPLECPNTFYVACTRATHGLYICENIENPSFKYLQKTHYEIQNEEYVKFNGLPKGKEIKSKTTKGEFSKITPTDLVKFIPETAFEEIIPILDVLFTDITTEKYGYTQKNIDIHSIIQTKAGFYEDVSDINGIMIPILYFENILNETGGVSFLQRAIETEISHLKPSEHRFLKQICKKLPDNYTTISDHLFLANVYKAVQEKVYSKIKQIQPDEYNWIKDEQLNECLLRMSDIMKDELIDKDKVEIEKTIITYDDENKHKKIDEILKEHIPEITKFRFHARIDALTPYSIWELKCVGHITKEHLLQVVIYAWLWRLTTNEEREFKIFNVKTAQVLQLNATTDQLTYIICILLKNKFKVQETKTDEEFIEDCKGIITNITNK